MRRNALLLLVFVAGMTSLGVEFVASRLLAPFFGTSLYVWGLLIGLVLVYLAAGYWLGGRLADRWPSADLLFALIVLAGTWIGFTPLAAYPILLASREGFATVSVGLVLGTLLGVVLLFAVPVILLGSVSPFAIRLLLTRVDTGGSTAGVTYALSTGGSLFGTLLTVFWLIPTFGSRPTLVVLAVVLIAVAVVALLPRTPADLWPWRWMPPVALLAVLAGSLLVPHTIKPPLAGRLLYEKDSAYGYIQVVQDGTRTELILNEGEGVHSIYDPTQVLTGGPWDYLMLGSYFRPSQRSEPVPRSVAILGLAGGTAARQLTAAFGPAVDVTGVEIDPDILYVAHRYFHVDQPNVHPVVQDARYWLAGERGRFDLIYMDAYRQPYVPFYLTTVEFFELVRERLSPGGAAVVDAGRPGRDYRLVDALASTMAAVYTNVFLVDAPDFGNTLIYGTTEPTSLADVESNLALAREPIVRQVAESAETAGDLRPSTYHSQVYTDDLAPVERLIDQIIFSYATGR